MSKHYTIAISREEMIQWVKDNCEMDDVFTVKELEEWARDNGFWHPMEKEDTRRADFDAEMRADAFGDDS